MAVFPEWQEKIMKDVHLHYNGVSSNTLEIGTNNPQKEKMHCN